MGALIAASVLVPLLLAGMLWSPASRALGLRLAPAAPLPALVLALAAPVTPEFDLPWLLLGARFGLDETGRVFLLFSALIWLAAGWFAHRSMRDDARHHAFAGLFLLTQAGNLGVCLALDAASFYFCFAVMSIAAYGLVVHDGHPASRRAGRVYLVLALVGEMLILSGLLLAVGNAYRVIAVICLILGFGVKTGLPLLHVSLPLAYAAAPVPGAAVLAGAMIKAGLLGWLRFLPLGEMALPGVGGALTIAGLLAIFYGAALGLTQRQPGALLAYSSMSQMGYVSIAIGAGLLAPASWPLLLPGVVLFALHHALAKAALFLGLGVVDGAGATRAVLAGLALPALALAGAPLTSGVLAKGGLKAGLAALPAPWADLLAGVLPLAALGTALLMLRLLWLVGRDAPPRATPRPAMGLIVPWLLLLVALPGLAWLTAPAAVVAQALDAGALLDAAWPVLAALVLGAIALRRHWRAPTLPPGDVLVPMTRALDGLERALAPPPWRRWRARLQPDARAASRLARIEAHLRGWRLAGALWLALLAGLIALLLRGAG